MKIDHNTLTEDQLEEFVEFIDWSLVSSSLLTEEVKRKFKDITELQVRLWFEELLNSMEIKMDRKKFPYSIFFFKEGEWYMELDTKNGNLWGSNERIWSTLRRKTGASIEKMLTLIVEEMKRYFNGIEVKPAFRFDIGDDEMLEDHFRNISPCMDKPIALEEYFWKNGN